MENKQDDMQQKNMSPVAAGITGFILGVLGTTAVALSDKDTRTKVSKKANALKDGLEKWSKDTLHDLQETGDALKKSTAEKRDQIKTQSSDAHDEIKEKNNEDVLPEIK